MANSAIFPNAFDQKQFELLPVQPGQTVAEWLEVNGLAARIYEQPMVVTLNGIELVEAEYTKAIEEGDVVILTALPQWNFVVQAAIYIYQYWQVIALVLTVALVLTMPEPGLPTTADQEEGSPTYSVNSRGNRARLGQPKPVLYGTFRVYPDLSATPFTVYENGKDQVLYQLFEVSQGELDIDPATMRFEDTLLNNFEDYEVEIIPPGQTSALFPSAVVTSSEISNLELLDANSVAYSASAPGQRTVRLSLDVVASGGLFEQDKKSGNLKSYSVQVLFEAREIDDNGAALGSWFTVDNPTLTADNRDPIRKTYSVAVPAGRYEVRGRRITAKNSSMYVGDVVHWSVLNAYLEDETGVTSTTRVALKIRSSEQLGNRTLTQFNLVATRKLPVWDANLGWQGPVATASPVWAFCDIARASYGGARPDAYLDLPGLAALAAQLDAEGVEFNGTFDTKSTVWDALTRVAQSARCMPVDRGGVYHLVRDSYSAAPVAMFTHRNIVKDTFTIDHIGVLEETSDAVVVVYKDATADYREQEITCALPGSPASTPRRVQLFGVTDRDQAYKLGLYMAAQNQYRRERVSFVTGREGFIPFYGSTVAVSHWMLGQEGAQQASGDVVAFDGVDLLTLSEDLPFFANPYITLRGLHGEPVGPYLCAQVADNQVRITEAFDNSVLVFDAGYDRPHFMLGEGVEFAANVKITAIEPQGDGKIKISGFVDAPEVYTAADGLNPPPIDTLPQLPSISPVVSNLQAYVAGTVDEPVVQLNWDAANADFYVVEYSSDGGNTWLQLGAGRTVNTTIEHRPVPGILNYRVAGFNLLRGAWVSVVVDTNTIAFAAPPAPTALTLRESFTGSTLKLQWSSLVEAHRIQFTISDVEYYADAVEGTEYDLPAEVAQAHGLGRSFDVRVWAIAPNGKESVTAPQISVSNPAPAALNNLTVSGLSSGAIVTFDWPTDPDVVGINVWLSTTNGFVPSATSLMVDRTRDPVIHLPIEGNGNHYVRAAAVDAWGTTGLNISGQYTVVPSVVDTSAIEADLAALEGRFPIGSTDISDSAISTPKLSANAVTADKIVANAITSAKISALAVQAAHLAANSVTADKINVGQLAAISADLGTVTAGKFATTPGTGTRVEIDASTNYPIWIGSGSKTPGNAKFYYDKASNKLYILGDTYVRGDIQATSLGANGIVQSAHIQDLNVTTLKIANEAVTKAVSVSGAWSGTSKSLTIATSGSPVNLWVGVRMAGFLTWVGESQQSGVFSLTRGATNVGGVNVVNQPVFTSDGTWSMRDTPGAGTHTYTLSVGSANSKFLEYYIIALEVKK